jgi:hypothetical protein
LADQKGVATLSDNSVIIRKSGEGVYVINGMPWRGEDRAGSTGWVRLDKLLIIHHTEVNHTKNMKPTLAALDIFRRSFPPLMYPDGLQFSLDFIADLSQIVSCYDLGFRAEKSIVEFVRNL